VLDAWFGGEFGGQAIAEVLHGSVDPSGRLPVTFYEGVDQLPPFTDYAMKGRTYRYFKGDPEYAFGHGLSYTRFAYSGLRVASPTVKAGDDQVVTVTIRNGGQRAGDEVAQLYLAVPDAPDAPIRSLKGFRRVHLASEEQQTVRFMLTPRDLAQVGEDGVFRIKPATYHLWVGGGQPGTGASGETTSFRTVGTRELPR
jgi:beta-glucosidase